MNQAVKILIFIFGALFILNACKNNSSNDESGLSSDVINIPASGSEQTSKEKKIASIEFKETEHDFGKLTEGEKVSYSFKFTNTGDGNLIIANVIPGCGCTVSNFPKQPIKPGESDFIDLVFDSSNRPGNFIKDATVYANTIPNTHKLYIKGFVNTTK